ncbi:hypothetical protein GGI35DRAFT_123193 [Trichoderma velutinum]
MSKVRSESLMESPINKYKFWVPQYPETSARPSPPRLAKARQAGAVSWKSKRESTEALSTSSIIELYGQCTSAFESCMRHEGLMEQNWAKYSFADFNFIFDCFRLPYAPRPSLDRLLDSGASNRFMLHRNLTKLEAFLAGCISYAEAQSSTDEATMNVGWSLKILATIAQSIIPRGTRFLLARADIMFKSEEHEELRAFLGIVCLRQHTRNGFGAEAQHDVARLETLSTDECIKISEGLKLSEAQQRLIEVNLRRRNRFLQAQRFAQHDIFCRPNKASTAHGNSGGAENTPSKSAITANMALTAAARYPRAPDLPQGATNLKCPCCYETLTAKFANDNSMWREHLVGDISPYTCILPDCPAPLATYTTVAEWEKHFEDNHRPWHTCWLCDDSNSAFPGLEALAAHIQTKHAEEASPGFARTVTCWSDVKTIGTSQCPLCDLTGIALSPEFIRHVLNCIHDFSLYSLPWDRLHQN